jgi:hypothetical protein
MIDEPTEPPSPRAKQRQDRLRNALRENLKRRKSQSRGRAVSGAADDGASSTDSEPSSGPDAMK